MAITYIDGVARGPNGEQEEIEFDVSECYIGLPQGGGTSPVVLGQPGDEALLGVVTLGNLGLVFHPFSRTLHPMRMLMVGMRLSSAS